MQLILTSKYILEYEHQSNTQLRAHHKKKAVKDQDKVGISFLQFLNAFHLPMALGISDKF